jgi:hypothetical protein
MSAGSSECAEDAGERPSPGDAEEDAGEGPCVDTEEPGSAVEDADADADAEDAAISFVRFVSERSSAIETW